MLFSDQVRKKNAVIHFENELRVNRVKSKGTVRLHQGTVPLGK